MSKSCKVVGKKSLAKNLPQKDKFSEEPKTLGKNESDIVNKDEKNKRIRGWCFTINNYTEIDITMVRSLHVEGGCLIIGYEVGDGGTRHLQCYIELKNAKTFDNMRKAINYNHVEPRKGSSEAAWKYCMKGEQTKLQWYSIKNGWEAPDWGKNAVYEEYGTFLQPQGRRNDIHDVVALITSGEVTNVKELALTNPIVYNKFRNTLHDARTVVMNKRPRQVVFAELFPDEHRHLTQGFMYVGKSGCGKSYECENQCEMLGLTPYTYPSEDHGWLDDYAQEHTMVIEDMRGHTMKYDTLLRFIDWKNFVVPRRNVGPIPFISQRVLINSSLLPSVMFPNRNAIDGMEQFWRRIKVFFRSHWTEEWKVVTADNEHEFIAIREAEEEEAERLRGVKKYDEHNLPPILPYNFSKPVRKVYKR